MDAKSLQKATELGILLNSTTEGLANLKKYVEEMNAPFTGRIEVLVPHAPGRPPHEPQTINVCVAQDGIKPLMFTAEEAAEFYAAYVAILQKRIDSLNAQISAL